ncbi:hypothetical protein Ga0609869_002393 [Rhodovulum iodosum]|uniref:Uncharacterized protein n=1 Tax=Rhodovulum iodosum TaxID=68291 RepID=A0ABV3XW96_9RHOB
MGVETGSFTWVSAGPGRGPDTAGAAVSGRLRGAAPGLAGFVAPCAPSLQAKVTMAIFLSVLRSSVRAAGTGGGKQIAKTAARRPFDKELMGALAG